VTQTKNLSYLFMAFFLILLAKTHLLGAFIIILFSYLALTYLQFKGRKWVGVALFFILVTLIFYSFGFVINKAIVVIPSVASEAIPKIVEYANQQDIDLPFSDVESLKTIIVDGITNQLAALANLAKVATKQFVFIVIALVMVVNLYIRNSFRRQSETQVQNTLLDEFKIRFSNRFSTLYESFRVVMGAQVLISAINTFLTGIYIFVAGIDYPFIIIFFTFLCGLLPVIGNVISNTLIVGISLTISIKITVISLVYLVLIHKLEYFLNSKIIGERIKTPMWLTLLGLALGEKLMGLPGMVIAPVLLNYIKMELAALPPDYLANLKWSLLPKKGGASCRSDLNETSADAEAP